jgi:RHH-type proline utilization regulon transcriptional repressor/proline dehydrogenase/delta 1-pyrroline-5-carboxylate dehydrogenase
MALFRSKTPRKAAPPTSTHSASIAAGPVSTNGAKSDPGQPVAFNDGTVEQGILRLGGEFLDAARKHKSGFLSTAFWSDKLMDWTMKDEAFKVQFFRFVDTFPTLTTSDAVYEHWMDYMAQPGVTPPPGMGAATALGGIVKGGFAKVIASQITAKAEKFIAGTDAQSALPQLKKLWQRGIAFSVDLLGEACVSDE